MIKLIVKYTFQVWTGDKYRIDERSIILSYKNKNEVTNQAIEEAIRYKEKKSPTIISIDQIN